MYYFSLKKACKFELFVSSKIGGPQDSIDDFADDKTVPRVCRPSSRNSRLSYPLPGLHDKVPHSNDSDSESEEVSIKFSISNVVHMIENSS